MFDNEPTFPSNRGIDSHSPWEDANAYRPALYRYSYLHIDERLACTCRRTLDAATSRRAVRFAVIGGRDVGQILIGEGLAHPVCVQRNLPVQNGGRGATVVRALRNDARKIFDFCSRPGPART